jgi:hypothetical protein
MRALLSLGRIKSFTSLGRMRALLSLGRMKSFTELGENEELY